MRLFDYVRKHLIPHRLGFVAAETDFGASFRMPGSASRTPYYVLGGIALGLVLLAEAPRQPTSDADLEQLLNQASTGSRRAEVMLGLAYRDGRYGLSRNPNAAVAWFTRAAQAGDDYAASLLGDAYAQGDGVATDMNAAERWWRQAALADDVHAESRLGLALVNGSATPAQAAEGRRWLERAAVSGDIQASHALGIKVPIVTPVADAIDHEFGVGQGHGILGNLTRLALGDVPFGESIDNLKQRALAGDSKAEYQLALRYRDGSWGVAADPKLALVWLQQAARLGNPMAMTSLSDAYAKGLLGLPPDPAEASLWRSRADAARSEALADK
jgi:TPR repeat protein